MESAGWMGKLHVICQWISRLAYVNLLWMAFSLIGLILLGTSPATVALFTVVRKWLLGETNFPVFALFWKTYRAEFMKANSLGFIILGAAAILYFDWRLINAVQGSLNSILTGCLIGVLFLFLVVLVYVFPVYVHFDYNVFQYLKTAFLLGITYPIYTFAMCLVLFCALSISFFFTGVGLVFLGSGISYALMSLSNSVFSKISEHGNAKEA